MSLNNYTEEARHFLEKMNALNEDVELKLKWLDEEFQLLNDAVDKQDKNKIQHQIYDMLFILFEISAEYNLDLDSEWKFGRKRKQEKYLTDL